MWALERLYLLSDQKEGDLVSDLLLLQDISQFQIPGKPGHSGSGVLESPVIALFATRPSVLPLQILPSHLLCTKGEGLHHILTPWPTWPRVTPDLCFKVRMQGKGKEGYEQGMKGHRIPPAQALSWTWKKFSTFKQTVPEVDVHLKRSGRQKIVKK